MYKEIRHIREILYFALRVVLSQTMSSCQRAYLVCQRRALNAARLIASLAVIEEVAYLDSKAGDTARELGRRHWR